MDAFQIIVPAMNCLQVGVMLLGVIRKHVKESWRCDPVHDNGCGDTLPSCTILIPCFLPNEQSIIVDTVRAALALDHIEKVVLIYNTPHPLPEAENALNALSSERFVCALNPESTSRAENVVYGLTHHVTSEAVLLLDSDHRVVADSHATMLAELQGTMAVCVQGSVVVRGTSCFARALDVLGHLAGLLVQPTMEAIVGSALFIGAGALWRTAALRAYGLKRHTSEDGELTLRLLADKKFVYASARGYVSELPPCSVREFVQQRTRWIRGFEDALHTHLVGTIARNPRAVALPLYIYGTYAITICNLVVGMLMAALHRVPSIAAASVHAATALLVFALLVTFYRMTRLVAALERKRLRLTMAIAACFLYAGLQTTLFFASYAQRLRMRRRGGAHTVHVTRRAVPAK